MKTSLLLFVLLSNSALSTQAQSAQASSSVATASPSELLITEHGPHHSLWSRLEWTTNRIGQVHVRTNLAYVELASGLNRLDPQTGQWVEAGEQIESVSGGALARQGQHTVFFANDIATAGAIRLQSVDGKLLVSNPLGLAYLDVAAGTNVLIAQVKSCQGEIIGSNAVIYRDAMTEVPCSIRYRNSRAGLEQDIILEDPEHLPSPADYGLNPATSRLVVLTEFIDPPQPATQAQTITNGTAVPLTDERLDFGAMQIGAGKALCLGTNAEVPSLRIFKQWVEIEERHFLLEQIPFPKLYKALSLLARYQGSAIQPPTGNKATARHGAERPIFFTFNTRNLPTLQAPTEPDASRHAMQVSSATPPEAGFLLDYSIVSSQASYTFQGDRTYYVSGLCSISDTATIEGNSVIKFAPSPSPGGLSVNHVVCKTGPYRMAVLTSKNDNTIGETITGSTGSPSSSEGARFLYTSWYSSSNTFKYLRFLFAGTALEANDCGMSIWHCQFVSCGTAVTQDDEDGFVNLYNVLFSASARAISSTDVIWVHGEHVTSDCAIFNTSYSASVSLINSIVLDGSINGTPTLDNCYTPDQTAWPFIFQSLPAANYYIFSGTTLEGSPNINATLRKDLITKTVYAPNEVTANISTPTTWQPNPLLRDTGANPWMGYHYETLDYATGAKVLSSTLTLQDGVAVALYSNPGINMYSGAHLVSEGSPLNLNRIVHYQTVQEQPYIWGSLNVRLIQLTPSSGADSEFQMRFTEISQSAPHVGCGTIFSANAILAKSLTDCVIHGGVLGTYYDSDSGYPPVTVSLKNSVFDRVSCDFEQESCQSDCIIMQVWNNLFLGGNVTFCNWISTDTWDAHDNVFDTPVSGNNIRNSHNAYVGTSTRLGGQGQGTGDVAIATADFVSGPLGDYYYPTTGGNLSTLTDAGSRTAVDAGLANYTTQADQTPEGSSDVDIGFHYLGASPLDVAFIIDNTGSMGGSTLTKLRDGIDTVLDSIETLSGGDYSLALVTPDEDQVNVRLCFGANNRAAFTSALNQDMSNISGVGTPESTDECLNTVVNSLRASPLRGNPRVCSPRSSPLQNIDFSPGFRTSVRKFVVLVTDHEPGGFCDEGDSGAQAALYASQAHNACIRINSIQVDDNSDATPIMLNYYHTSCGWYEQLPHDGTGVVEAVIRMLYDPGYCSCP